MSMFQVWLIPTPRGRKKFTWMEPRPLAGARKYPDLDGARREMKRYWLKIPMEGCPRFYQIEAKEVQ
jgi:hypothetical protein